MTIQIRQIDSSASAAAVRGHRIVIDRPVDKGGADQGPMGGELFLASVGGCFMSNLLAAVKARQAHVSDIETAVTGTIAGSPPRFTAIEVSVTAECPDVNLFQKLVEIADRGCIMMNTLRDKIDMQVRIAVRV